MHTRLRLLALTASAVTVMSSLAACGGGEAAAPAEAGKDGLVKLTWGYTLTDAAPVLLGIQEGVFEEHGFDIEAKEIAPADFVGGLVSGALDLSVNTGTGLAVAVSQSVPTVAVAGLTTFDAGQGGSSGSALLVGAGSDIEEPCDLVGKSVGVNLLKSASEMGIRQMVADEGCDESQVRIVEVPFASMGDAIENGDVVAALEADPFLTEMLDSGEFVAPMGDPIEIVFGSSPRLLMTATSEWVAQNPGLVEALRDAVQESIELAESDPDALHMIYEKQYDMSPEVARATELNDLSADVDASKFDTINEVLVRFGLLEEPVDGASLVAP